MNKQFNNMTELICKSVGNSSLLGTAIKAEVEASSSFVIEIESFMIGVCISDEIACLKRYFPNAKVVQK